VTQVDSGQVSSAVVDRAQPDHQRTVASNEHDVIVGNRLVVVVPVQRQRRARVGPGRTRERDVGVRHQLDVVRPVRYHRRLCATSRKINRSINHTIEYKNSKEQNSVDWTERLKKRLQLP